MKNLERKILFGVLAGAAVYAAVAIYADVGALSGALANYAWWTLAAAIALTCANYALRFAKWEIFLRRIDVRIPLGRSLLIFMAGFVMSITPGKLGEVLKSFLLRQSDSVPAATTAPVILAERLTDLLGLIILAATGIGTYQYGTTALAITTAIIALGLLAVSMPAFVDRALGLLDQAPIFSSAVPKLREAYTSTRRLLAPAPLLGTTALSVISWGMECVAFVLIVRGFENTGVAIDISLAGGTFVYAITTIVGAISFLPGGLGVTEAGMISVLQILDMVGDEAVASAATILIRLATLWWAVACGVVAFVIFQRTLKTRRLHEPTSPS